MLINTKVHSGAYNMKFNSMGDSSDESSPKTYKNFY